MMIKELNQLIPQKYIYIYIYIYIYMYIYMVKAKIYNLVSEKEVIKCNNIIK